MSSAMLVVIALALICAALALLLLQRDAQRKEQAGAERFIDSRMAPAAAAPGAAAPRVATVPRPGVVAGAAGATGAATPAARGAQGPQGLHGPQAPRGRLATLTLRARHALDTLMSRAGIAHARALALVALGAALLLCVSAAREGGLAAAAVALLACLCFAAFLLSMRMQRQRRAIVRQLPSFLDGIVRLITLGNSVPAAFQGALLSTEAPLRDCLDQVSRMLRTGVEIDRALSLAALRYGARELELVGAVLRLSVKYGGRADVMLDRMASFMRDLEQAEHELAAMSAETRLSAWVLALMPVGIGGLLILGNPHYFGAMWYDPFGRDLVYLAFGLQIVGAWVLYRMTRLGGR
jgi:tight adherence protein B